MENFLNLSFVYLVQGSILLGSIALGFAFYLFFMKVMRAIMRRTETTLGDIIIKNIRSPLRIVFPSLLLILCLQFIELPQAVIQPIHQFFTILFTVLFAWMLIKVVSILEEHVRNKFRLDTDNTVSARKIKTQFQFLKKLIVIVICVVTLAIVLMSFEKIRQLGTTLLASAGVVGLVIGIAAQKFLGTILAGFQIAFTQPIRLNDVVIVENEWGWIEEITLTYVVVRIWDLRRLVLPINYFIDKPFQNWTRASSNILGTLYVYSDYTIPVQEIREELMRLAAASPLWDGKVCGLQVTDAKEKTIELRALVSAEDSGKCLDLRCEIREKIIEFIRTEHPGHLPKIRVVVVKGADFA
jgi:small-conductance mechanosensitive channel